MKRTILTLLLLSLGLVTTIAQTELGMNYQAVIRDAEGHIVANTTVGIQIQILQESTSGTAVYTETFTPTTNEFGLINLIIGQGQAKYGKYADIDWSMAKYFLRIELDITGGTTYEEMGTSQLLSVPYANYAFDGVTGKSAYQAWLDLGNTGTQEDFINSLTGPAGEAGPDGKSAYQTWLDLGNTGTQEDFINSLTGPAGEAGPDGKSAYQAWLDLGNTGTQEDFINSLTGPAGEAGTDGESAYQAWLNLGNTGTQENFINSLTGPAGEAGTDGESAYQAWLDLGNTGTQENFINSLTGPAGEAGTDGESAYQAWLDLGNTGTQEDFINSLTGPAGTSAYQVWLDLGNIGTEDDFINSLTGPAGTSSWVDAELNVSTKQKVGIGTSTPSAMLEVVSDGKSPDVALFEVKNSKGEKVFAIYENRVEIIVDEEPEGLKTRGGFAISGRTTTKATKELMSVTPEETTIYVDEPTAKTRGGFAISGRTTTKTGGEILLVTPSLTQVFVDETTGKTRGGFAISGRTTTKAPVDLLNITPSLTQFYVDETTAKTRGGFAISGRTTTKGGIADIFTVTPDSTQIFVKETENSTKEVLSITSNLTQLYVDETTGKTRGGFAISGRTTTKAPVDLLNITPSLTQFYVDETTAKTRGGFAISGRTTTKGGIADIFTVTPDSTQIFVKESENSTKEVLSITSNLTQLYVDETTGKTRGGFAISGRTTTKASVDLLNITPSLTQFYVDETTAKTRGGFAISGRTTTKGGIADILTVTPDSTQIFVKETENSTKEVLSITSNLTQLYVDGTTTGKTRGGFAISGRTTTKETKDMISVTANETTIFVDEPTAKTRGGFAISGRTTTKTGGEVLLVTPSLTQFYVDKPTAKTRGGFAISGRTTTKTPVDLLNITPELTQFYVDKPTGKTRGGFAISGRTTTKEGEADILTVTPDLTQVFIEETTAKTRGGFAISGRTTTKETGMYDVFTVVPERTDVYIKPSTNKNSLPIGFGVHGLDESASESTEFFSISGAGTYVATSMAVKPTVVTGLITGRTQTSAKGSGEVTDRGGVDVTLLASGIVYHTANLGLLSIEEASELAAPQGGVISIGTDYFNNLEMLNLTPNTAYTVRAFATNSDNLTGYGQPKQFTTLRKYEVIIKTFDGDGTAPTPFNATVTLLNEDTQETIVSEPPSSTHTFNLTNNAYVLKVEAEGYHTHTEEYTPTGNETKEVILYSTQADETLVTFTATDNDGPVSNVKIKIGTVVNYTNNLGVATFYLASGVHTYWPTVPEGYEEVYATTVSVPQESNVDITLRKQVKVTFNVKNPNGTPTTQAYGYITYVGEYEWDPFESTFDVSNGTGHVFLPPDSLGTWNYSITSDIYTANGNIVLIENSDDIVEPVQLQGPPATYTVKVHITGTDNEDIMDAMVMLTDNTYFEEVQYSDVDGMVTFENVIVHGDQPDMQYHLTITKDGFEEIDERFYLDVWSIMQLDPNGTGTITIERELTPL